MPSVLIELGFLTNNKEGPYINSKKGRREMSYEIARSILEYKAEIDFATESQESFIQGQAQQSDDLPGSGVDQNQSEQTVSDSSVQFKVQISASGKKLATKAYNFKGLTSISRQKESGLYRYFYGETSDYDTAKQLQVQARKKGYKQAFIVAFKAGERISVDEVLNN